MAGYTRTDTTNNIADGNIINAADLDNEFDGIQAAFNSSTGHNHDGTTGEGAPILVLGPSQDVVVGSTTVTPKLTNTVDIGSSSLKFKDLYLAGTLNVTTIDTTNLEVTNIKAKDGTASITIADSTGAVSFANNVTLGDASTDIVKVTGYMGVGGDASANYVLRSRGNITGGTTGYGVASTSTVQSDVTTAALGLYAALGTVDTAFTLASLRQLQVAQGTKGAASTITDQHGIYISDLTNGTNNYGITSLVSSGTNKWNIYASGTAANYFAGNVLVGDTTSTTSPLSAGSFITASSTTGSELILKNSSGIVTGELVGGVAFGNDDPTSGTPPHYSGIQARSIDSSGTMTLGFYTGLANYEANTPQVLIDASGNMGIGTSSPLALLNTYQVNGGGDANILFQNFSTTTSTAVALYLSPTNGSLTTGSIRSAFIKGINVGGGVTALTFGTNSSGADPTEKMRIDSSGNVGIGETSPTAKLHVAGGVLLGTNLANPIAFTGSSSSNAGIGSYTANTDMNVYAAGTGNIKFVTGSAWSSAGALTTVGTERMRIDSSGNVGIGNDSPTVKLDVAGSTQSTWSATSTSISGTTMTIAGTVTGTIAIGDLVYGTGVQPYTRIVSGSATTWIVSVSQTVASATLVGAAVYSNTLIRISNTDTSEAAAQPTGGLQFYTSDASAPTAGVGAYVAALAETTTPDTALVFGTRDNGGGGVDANERMRIDSSGNVGIGTSSPSEKLTVAGNITNTGTATFGTSGSNTYVSLNNNGYLRCDVSNWFTLQAGTSGYQWRNSANSTTAQMTLDSSGNLGIGTSSPSFKLDVTGTLRSTGEGRFDNGINLKTATLNYVYFDDAVSFTRNGTGERMRIDTSGNVGIGTSSPNKSSSSTALTVNTGTAANYSAVEWSSGNTLNYHINANDSAIYHVAAGTRPWIVYTNGSERMRIDSSGQVGIGTSSPIAELHVSKDQNAATTVRISNATAGTTASAAVQVVSDTTGGLIASANSTVSTAAAITGGASGAGVYTTSAITGGLSVGTTAGPLKFFAGSTSDERARIDSSGTVTLASTSGLSIGRTAVTSPASTDGNVFSGTYTPTQVSTNTNVAAVIYSACQYMRVGNTVTVSGQVSIDPTTAATNTVVLMSLPIASSFSASRQLGGTGLSITAVNYASQGLAFQADTTNDCVEIRLNPVSASNVSYIFSFTYQVI